MFYRNGPTCCLLGIGPLWHASNKCPYVFWLADPAREPEKSLNMVLQLVLFFVQFDVLLET